MRKMSNSAELRARKWLAEQLAWERRLEELRDAAGVPGSEVEVNETDRSRAAA
jgi:hypothetical protein